MHTSNYRQKTGQRILLVVALIGTLCFFAICLAGCSVAPADGPSMESWLRELGVEHRLESRPAIIPLTERDLRDARGRFKTPVHAVTHESASTQQTIYLTPTGAAMHGPVYRIKIDHTLKTEIPKLTEP